jgi:uncharacterized delta-60 repeat protein
MPRVAVTLFLTAMLTNALKAQPGAPDPTFDGDGKLTTDFNGTYDEVRGITVQDDGRIVVVGTGGPSNRFAVARYTSTGQLDGTFNGTGSRIIDWSSGTPAVAVLPSGKTLLGTPDYSGVNWGFRVIRLNENGSFDNTFAGDGQSTAITGGTQPRVEALRVQPDGKIVLAGYDLVGGWNWVLVRFEENGAIDTAFGNNGIVVTNFSRPQIAFPIDFLYCIELQPDGKILAGGMSSTTGEMSTGNRIMALARYLDDGTPDPEFGTNGQRTFTLSPGPFYTEAINDIELLPDGRFLAVNATNQLNGSILRCSSDGSLDETFGQNGRLVPAATDPWRYAYHLAIDEHGFLLVQGYNYSVTRMTLGGQVDGGFGAGGTGSVPFNTTSEGCNAMAVQPDGRIIIGGYSGTSNSNWNWSLARLQPGLPGGTRVLVVGSLDGLATSNNGGPFAVTDGQVSINVQRAATVERRGLLEFNISGLPPRSQILSARLDLDIGTITNSGGNYPRLAFYGYAGDGVLTVADAALTLDLLATTNPITGLGPLVADLTLAAPFVSELREAHVPYLGLMAYGAVASFQAAFYASEFPTPDFRPQLTIQYVPPCPDLDADGSVDLGDLAVLLSHFGSVGSVTWEDGDLNGDGDVDLSDLTVLLSQFGTTCP